MIKNQGNLLQNKNQTPIHLVSTSFKEFKDVLNEKKLINNDTKAPEIFMKNSPENINTTLLPEIDETRKETIITNSNR